MAEPVQKLLFPASRDMLPALAIAHHLADVHCRPHVAHFMLSATYPDMHLSVDDIGFVFSKLSRHAPHLLGANLAVPTSIPFTCQLPHVPACIACSISLSFLRDNVVPCITSLTTHAWVKVRTQICKRCHRQYSGPWVFADSSTGHADRFLTTSAPGTFNTTPNILFHADVLDMVTSLLVNCGGSFRGIAASINFPPKTRHFETLLRDSWMQYSLVKFLGDESLGIPWNFRGNRMESMCRSLEPRVTQLFQRRWLHTHRCNSCSNGLLVVDGNAKIRTKLCANTDDGVWNCPIIKAHCLTGCQNAPMPGRKFCALHLHDADPVLGNDLLVVLICFYLIPRNCAAPLQCSCISCCMPVCKRLRKSLRFALLHSNARYPVLLLKAIKVSRSRKYVFQNAAGKRFSLLSPDVPVRFQQQFGFSMLEPEARECQLKPRVGQQLTFSAEEQKKSCRAQWERSSKARRSGGLLAAVKPCQVIAAVKLVYTHESPTGVYFFLAELLASFAAFHNVALRQKKYKARVRFMRNHMPLVSYDCACTLKRFLTQKKRKNRNKVTRTLAKLKLVIDKFHFRKGHSGCRPNGTSPLPSVWPQSHTKFGRWNDSSAEQAFAFLKRLAVAARRMSPVRGLLFVLLLQHSRNLALEHSALQKQEKIQKQRAAFRHKRSLADRAESAVLRHARRGQVLCFASMLSVLCQP
eukprot:Skav222689  [mRNA]  locus=scaffold5100:4446:6524:- [translate_table: standard]